MIFLIRVYMWFKSLFGLLRYARNDGKGKCFKVGMAVVGLAYRIPACAGMTIEEGLYGDAH